MHTIKTNFDKIIGLIKDIIGDKINEKGNYLRRGTRPKFSDIEVIALSLTAECLSIDSENYLFFIHSKLFQYLSVFLFILYIYNIKKNVMKKILLTLFAFIICTLFVKAQLDLF